MEFLPLIILWYDVGTSTYHYYLSVAVDPIFPSSVTAAAATVQFLSCTLDWRMISRDVVLVQIKRAKKC